MLRIPIPAWANIGNNKVSSSPSAFSPSPSPKVVWSFLRLFLLGLVESTVTPNQAKWLLQIELLFVCFSVNKCHWSVQITLSFPPNVLSQWMDVSLPTSVKSCDCSIHCDLCEDSVGWLEQWISPEAGEHFSYWDSSVVGRLTFFSPSSDLGKKHLILWQSKRFCSSVQPYRDVKPIFFGSTFCLEKKKGKASSKNVTALLDETRDSSVIIQRQTTSEHKGAT